MIGMSKAVWDYRYFILSSIKNDIVSKFSSSKLGFLWLIINPLAQVTIFALILSNVLSAKLPGITNKYSYAIYLMAGLLPWLLCSEIINRCLNMFIEKADLMKKINFPRITIPTIAVGSSLFNNLLLLSAVLAIFLILGHTITFAIFWIFPLLLILTLFSLSIGLILGIINIFIRDVSQVVPIAMQMLFWVTPIVYPRNIIPADYQPWLKLNPIFPIISSYQDVLIYGKNPSIATILIMGAIVLTMTILSLIIFRRASPEIVDVL